MSRRDLDRPIFDLCSPARTGLGLEILRTIVILKAAFNAGYHSRLWTFHPLAFDDKCFEIVPLQEGRPPLFPDDIQSKGAVWMPGSHPAGPYICKYSLNEAVNRGFLPIHELESTEEEQGGLPVFVEAIATQLFSKAPLMQTMKAGWGMYPADELRDGEAPSIVLNLIGAHGKEKGLNDVLAAIAVANKVANAYPMNQFILLLHARVLSGQKINPTPKNLQLLIHLDDDPRVARLLHQSSKIVTIEGGFAHSALERDCNVTLIGLKAWLESTAYLYDERKFFKKISLNNFSIHSLSEAVIKAVSSEI